MLLAGLVSLLAAQIVGLLGLRHPGYELLAAIAMFVLAMPLLAMAAHAAFVF